MNTPCPGHERYQIAKPDTISDPITIRGDDYRDGDEIEVPVFPILDHSAKIITPGAPWKLVPVCE